MKELYFPHLAVEQSKTLYQLALSNSLGLCASAGELERKAFLRQISIFRGNVAAAACRAFGFDAALYAIECQSAPALVDEPPIVLSELKLVEDAALDDAQIAFLHALILEDYAEKREKLRTAFLLRLKTEEATKVYLTQPTAVSLFDALFAQEDTAEFESAFPALCVAYANL